jgi:hypothetical protein
VRLMVLATTAMFVSVLCCMHLAVILARGQLCTTRQPT